MEKILLIEPDYKNKYVPLGLMKIAYYHKEIKGDLVWFSKGELPNKITKGMRKKVKEDKYYKDRYGENIDNHLDEIDKVIDLKSWDKVYITTLFTFEYDTVIDTINYVKSIIKDNSKIYVGGILATLMPDKLREDTDVNVLVGQLTDTEVIGYNDSVNIDILTPDYSILSNTEYSYANSSAYYSYTTRGCGMNCGFCAVKTLEPEFIPYISIKEQIQNINRLYGEKKDLLLMDNNILKSKYLSKIVDDLISLGFQKDAEYLNSSTGRKNKRYIDFNQGLDAKLMTKEKASLLGRLALKPARVAFDHIEDKEIYIRAMKMLIENGTTYLSNYLLYNSDSFSGKGTLYEADTPEDLYERLRINIELQREENERIGEKKVNIYSFPMRYIPLDGRERGYVGPKWNKKCLRAIQVMLLPTSGKGVSNPEYFYNIFGRNEEEFLKTIMMPEKYLTNRGIPQKDKIKDEAEYIKKINNYNQNLERIKKWNKLYSSFNGFEYDNFKEVIGNNKFDYEDYLKIKYDSVRKIYTHYTTPSKLINIFENLELNEIKIYSIKEYIEEDARFIYDELIDYIVTSTVKRKNLKIIENIMDIRNIIDMLDVYEKINFKNENFYNTLLNIDEDNLYIAIHTWIRNRRINGLMQFAVDVAHVLIESEDLDEGDRKLYIRKKIITLFKDFLRYKYTKKYHIEDKYELYKYDIEIINDQYDPYSISYSMKQYDELYSEYDKYNIYDDGNIYYDDYESFLDEYSRYVK